jgi:Na+/H+ antiporter NhaD/arsenite permease-like protein
MTDEAITFLIVGVAVVVFAWDRLPVAVVTIAVALSLWATGILTLEESLAGFGDPTVVFIAALLIVADSLDATGVTGWVSHQLIDRAGASRARLLLLTMGMCVLLTLAVTPNAAVPALVPVVAVMAARTRRAPSQLLMPLAFVSLAGSVLILTATPVNIITSNAAADAGVGAFGYFEFALVGAPLLAGTVAIILLLGERLLPNRTPKSIQRDFSQHAATLVEHYGRTASRADFSRAAVESPRS